LDSFELSPSVGASGGLLTIWNGNLFDGELIFWNAYSITIKFTLLVTKKSFHLTNIYGPSTDKAALISWLYNFDALAFDDCILLGDFNMIRSPNNRNRWGGNPNEMMLFNDLILHLDLIDIPFQVRDFSWSNMQDNALLEKLDWIFTSASWTLSFPSTKVIPLSRPFLIIFHMSSKLVLAYLKLMALNLRIIG
jgi:hypothetical protein